MDLLGQARFRSDIIEAMRRPAEAKPWYKYRPIFVTMARTRAGVQFWRSNEALLERAEREYGVAPEIIVAIIGVETRYGGYTGKHRVLDALSTLAFGYPKRAPFFRKQLEEFLLLTREEEVDPLKAKGSYAGAMGMPQFIPSSYREYAVDFDADGKRDLWNSTADAIGSVANYFRRHGWRDGEQVTLKARVRQRPDDALAEAGLKPSLPMQRLAGMGVEVKDSPPGDTLVSLVRLENRNGEEYWLGLQNFYVITRYNHSALYAMAVYQLSREILAERSADRDELAAN
jgi:membrane-bound lytic murein transglycosylase B